MIRNGVLASGLLLGLSRPTHAPRGVGAFVGAIGAIGAAAEASAAAVQGREEAAVEEEVVIECDSGERFLLFAEVAKEEARSGATTEACRLAPVEGATFLPGHAGETATAATTLPIARSRCDALGSLCAGITLQPCRAGQSPLYTLRGGSSPYSSPQGEVSWLKLCQRSGGDLEAVEDEGLWRAGDEDEGDDGHEEAADPPSAEACGEERFARLRSAAADYYSSGVVSVQLLLWLGDILREAAYHGWQTLLARCAPGTLQVLLLRMEERVFVSSEEYSSLEAMYLRGLHDTLAAGAVSAAEWSGWQLKAGWSQASSLQRSAAQGLASGRGSVDFVLCFCGVSRSPGGGYPDVEDGLGWLVQLLASGSEALRSKTRVFVKEKCGEAVDPGLAAALKEALLPFAHVVEVDHVEDQLRADDATAYLAHLSGKHCDDLADWTFFLHADAPEHVHPFRLLEEVFLAARSGALDADSFPFMYLSHNFLDLGTSVHTWDNYASPLLWRRLFGSSIAPHRSAVKGYCCVQFVVPRRRLILRPREWYANAFGWFASAASYFSLFPAGKSVTWQDLTCRTPAQLWMPWWHVVFGEELSCPERHVDPRLPLFIQLRSIPADRIHCALGVCA
mmetsp:Transcript_129552/g.414312  ORF Transcript_129552/g.414312 Transcript_129552/m.414312 type:complete len:620 (-) Transcript_129552:28-1887(-)